MSQTDLRIGAARLGALGLLVAAAVVPTVTKVGPVVITLGPGIGLHALDVVLIAGGVPLAVVLLRYAEQLRVDGKEDVKFARVWSR